MYTGPGSKETPLTTLHKWAEALGDCTPRKVIMELPQQVYRQCGQSADPSNNLRYSIMRTWARLDRSEIRRVPWENLRKLGNGVITQ